MSDRQDEVTRRREESKARMTEAHEKSKAEALKEQENINRGDDQIEIGGELYTIVDVFQPMPGLVEIAVEEEAAGFILAKDRETAGQLARDRWQDMAENDPREFVAMVGTETLVAWALGQYAGPGQTEVQSLREWLDLIAEVPEEEFAGYDGEEQDVDWIGKGTRSAIGIDATVAYRSN